MPEKKKAPKKRSDKAPPYPGTRLRPVRVEDELWDEAKQVAASRGETVSGVVRAGLERYVKRHRAGK